MTGITLTEQQQKLLDIIKARIAEDGRAPTLQQMAEAMGVKTKSNIHRLLLGLQDRRAIRRLPGRARAIEIIDPAAGTAHGALLASRAFLARLRDELLRDFTSGSDLDGTTMDEDEAAYVAEVEEILAQIDTALPKGARHG